MSTLNFSKGAWFRGSLAAAGILAAVSATVPSAEPTSSVLPFVPADVQTYIVLYKENAVSRDVATTIARAGGTLVQSYDEIGVAIARSNNANFSANMIGDASVEGAGATGRLGVRVGSADLEVMNRSTLASATTAGPWGDPLSVRQWNMMQIHVPEAHEVTSGNPSVVVGNIDSGIDYTHPDLAVNVDFANSASCIGGVPNTDPAAWFDDQFHGTLTAGIIGAAANGIGIVGVAPNVKIASIKAGNAEGYFFPEAVICAFMWAGDRQIDVTNNSYFADPWLFNCRSDAEQRVVWKAEQRAIRYAMSKGVLVVAAQGNENLDLSKRNVDTISPDFPPGSSIEREVTNACVVIPVEIPGVVGVTANGSKLQKAWYSTYGVGVADVTAPGGDNAFQRPTPSISGNVLSTIPTSFCGGGPCYATALGTSLASPHAAGVAALIVSQFGKHPQGALEAALKGTADPVACPPNPFVPGGFEELEAICVGGEGYNGFFGHGQVNALNAVTNRR